MAKKLLYCLLLFLPNLSLVATLYETLDTHHLITVIFSSNHQNRITVDGGVIKKIMHPEGDVHTSIEETSGHVFVYSLVDYPPTTTLSLVLEDGSVQDIEMDFQKKRSEVLVLKYPEEKNIEKIPCIDLTWNGVTRLVHSVCEGRISDEYISCDYPNASKKLCRGVKAVLSGKLLGDNEVIYLWDIQNNKYCQAKLSESLFASSCVNWVYLHRDCLEKNQKTFAIVSVSR